MHTSVKVYGYLSMKKAVKLLHTLICIYNLYNDLLSIKL